MHSTGDKPEGLSVANGRTNGEAIQTNNRSRQWDHILSKETSARKPSIMQAMHEILGRKVDILSLGPGAPSSQYFPFDTIMFRTPAIGRFDETDLERSGNTLLTKKYDTKNNRSKYDLSSALDYGLGTGSAQLLGFVTEHTKIVHNPPYQDWKCILSGGNTFALDMAFRMFTEPGGYVLVEEYTYLTAIECGLPLGIKFAAIKIDDEGIIPKDFEEVLDTWDEAERAGKKPYLLYTVPTGQNPTGATPSIERRREIYRVAQKHNIYILEDDPYFFIQMLPNLRPNGSNPTPRVSQEQFVASLIPSYLSIDTDGRVFRMDSFSKIIAPGSRTSWITASEQIINRIVRVHETSLQNPAGFSQIMLYKLLHESWGHTGMMNWLFYLQMEYTVRRDNLVNAVETYLPNQLVSLTPPRAGFFAWVKLHWQRHPHGRSAAEIEKEIYDSTIREGALVVPGSWFQADPTAPAKNVFFRLTFASLQGEEMTEAVKRFGVAIRSCFELDPTWF